MPMPQCNGPTYGYNPYQIPVSEVPQNGYQSCGC